MIWIVAEIENVGIFQILRLLSVSRLPDHDPGWKWTVFSVCDLADFGIHSLYGQHPVHSLDCHRFQFQPIYSLESHSESGHRVVIWVSPVILLVKLVVPHRQYLIGGDFGDVDDDFL